MLERIDLLEYAASHKIRYTAINEEDKDTLFKPFLGIEKSVRDIQVDRRSKVKIMEEEQSKARER